MAKGMYRQLGKIDAHFIRGEISMRDLDGNMLVESKIGVFARENEAGNLQFLSAEDFVKRYEPADEVSQSLATQLADDGCDIFKLNAGRQDSLAEEGDDDEVIDLDLGKTITAEDTMLSDRTEALPLPGEGGDELAAEQLPPRRRPRPGGLADVLSLLLGNALAKSHPGNPAETEAQNETRPEGPAVDVTKRCYDADCPACHPENFKADSAGHTLVGAPEIVEITAKNAQELETRLLEAITTKLGKLRGRRGVSLDIKIEPVR